MTHILWHLELFGGFRATRLDSGGANSRDEIPLTIDGFRSQKTTALLAFLAFHRQSHRREWLAEHFWPESDIQKARNSLRVAIHNLRDTLEKEDENGQIIVATRDSLALSQLVSCDVLQFRELTRRGFASDDEKLLEQALSLVKGPLLRGFYEEWISPASAQLEDELLKVASRLIQLKEERDDCPGALDVARRAAAAAPTRVGIMRELVRLGIVCGEKESVRQEYEAWRKASNRLSGDKFPDWNTFSHGAARVISPPKPTASPIIAPQRQITPQPLPRSSSGFIGRNEELKQLTELFSNSVSTDTSASNGRGSTPARLVTLTGIGGIGKSRLALEAARLLQNEFAAVLWVSVGNLPSMNLLYGAIMDAAGATGQERLENVVSALQSLAAVRNEDGSSNGTGKNSNPERVLLVLDNCEQLSEATSSLINTLLDKMPSLSIMTTSLGSLRLSYEKAFPVGPLGPESVELFSERARQAKPNFQLNAENAAVISQLSEKLNGLPLAIEIAAARLALFTPQQMLEELSETSRGSVNSENSFLDWQNTNRDVPGRHRSLRQTIEWSARQLSPAALSFWSKLSVFTDDFTLDAAASVCRESQAPALVLALRDCSLLSIDLSREIPRGVWIESLRQFASSRLSAAQREELMAAHSQYFLHLAESLAAQLNGPNPYKAIARIDLERTHFRTAVEYLLTRHDEESTEERDEKIECALRICVSLSWYWEQSGHLAEGYKIIEATLRQALIDLPPLDLPVLDLTPLSDIHDRVRPFQPKTPKSQSPVYRALRLRARVLESAGKLANLVSDHENATKYIERALQLFRLIGDFAGAATCLYALGFGAMQRGELEEARDLCEQSVALTRKLNDPAALGDALYNLALVAIFGGDFETVKTISRESVELYRATENRRGVAMSLENLGLAGLQEGNPDIAQTYYQEALTCFEALGEGVSVARCLWGLGHVERFRGDGVKARKLFRRAMMLAKESQNLWAVPFLVEAFGYLAASDGDLTKAAQLLGGAAYIRELQGEPLPSPQLQNEFESTCANLRAQLGENLFEAHWQTGRILEREDLIEMAVDDEE